MTNEELCGLIRDGDTTALNMLWEQTGKLFYTIAHELYARHRERAASCGAEIADCQQVCWFAFLDAVEAYNRRAGREEQFASFVKHHVRRHIFTLLGLRTSKREPLNYADSLDAQLLADSSEITLGDTISDPSAELPFEEVELSGLADMVLERVSLLPERQQLILCRHYWYDKPFTQIAADLGLTPQSVHQIYRRALRKLRQDKLIQQIHKEFYANANFTKHTGFQFFKDNRMSSVEWQLLKLEERLERAKGGVHHDVGES